MNQTNTNVKKYLYIVGTVLLGILYGIWREVIWSSHIYWKLEFYFLCVSFLIHGIALCSFCIQLFQSRKSLILQLKNTYLSLLHEWQKNLLFCISFFYLPILKRIFYCIVHLYSLNVVEKILLALFTPYFFAFFHDALLIIQKEHLNKLRNQQELNNIAQMINPTDTILYLRSFNSDVNGIVKSHDGTVKRSYWKNIRNRFTLVKHGDQSFDNFESILCDMVSKLGKVIAIGDPNEKQFDTTVLSGVYRIYTNDDDWKEIVQHYMDTARFIVLYVDFTEGTLWEIQQIIEKYKNKTILVPQLINTQAYFKILNNKLMPKRFHRGKKYYRQWEQYFQFKIDDRISGVAFWEGKPVFSKAKNGRVSSQLNAIYAAITLMIRKFYTPVEPNKQSEKDQ